MQTNTLRDLMTQKLPVSHSALSVRGSMVEMLSQTICGWPPQSHPDNLTQTAEQSTTYALLRCNGTPFFWRFLL